MVYWYSYTKCVIFLDWNTNELIPKIDPFIIGLGDQIYDF